MPLQSELFRGDPKLEAAAVSDPAHIVPGATGEHVRKIQLALNQFDGAGIDPDGKYGPATAAAVLAYKRKRNIINLSYQTQADNIAGKMTVAALDREMLAAELGPTAIRPLDPIPFPGSGPRRGSGVVFGVNGPVLPQAGDQVTQTIKTINVVGRIQATSATRKTIARRQTRNPRQVAAIVNAIKADKNEEEIVVDGAGGILSYRTMNCGQTFFRGTTGVSNVVQLFVLVDVASARGPTGEDRSPDPNFKTGFLSEAGTPLNPLPGRKINLFGEGETPGFEDYSSDIDFCSHSFSLGQAVGVTGHRPWTDDPRKSPGIPGKTVNNICCRGSPIGQVTVDEILRIGASKCRVTYAEARGRSQADKLRLALGKAGATVIEEGLHDKAGRAIILELA